MRGLGVQPNGMMLRGRSGPSRMRGTTLPFARSQRVWPVPGMGPMLTASSAFGTCLRGTLSDFEMSYRLSSCCKTRADLPNSTIDFPGRKPETT